MAFSTQFFADGSTVYGASDFLAHFAKLFSDGIVSGLPVSAPSSGMTVNVTAGAVLSGGILSSSDTTESVTIPTNSGTSARTAAIVYQIDTSANAASFIDVQGASTAAANQILLAVVTVPASATSIVSADIDSSGRVYAGLNSPFGAVYQASASSDKGKQIGSGSGTIGDGGHGLIQFSAGLAAQFGVIRMSAYPTMETVTFPVPFDAAPYVIVCTMADSAPQSVSTLYWTASDFKAVSSIGRGLDMHWFAVGPMAVTHT